MPGRDLCGPTVTGGRHADTDRGQAGQTDADRHGAGQAALIRPWSAWEGAPAQLIH